MATEEIKITFTDIETATALLDNVEAITLTYTDVESITVQIDW